MNNRSRLLGGLAAFGGFSGVVLLSLSAHGARGEIIANWLNTAGLVLLFHVLAAFIALNRQSSFAASLFLAGSWLFAGALILLSFAPDMAIAGMAPLGGVTLLAGWAWLGWREISGGSKT